FAYPAVPSELTKSMPSADLSSAEGQPQSASIRHHAAGCSPTGEITTCHAGSAWSSGDPRHLESLYEHYRRDPSSIDESRRLAFELAGDLGGASFASRMV